MASYAPSRPATAMRSFPSCVPTEEPEEQTDSAERLPLHLKVFPAAIFVVLRCWSGLFSAKVSPTKARHLLPGTHNNQHTPMHTKVQRMEEPLCVQVTVLFFAGARDLVPNGSRSAVLPWPGQGTLQEFVDRALCATYPSMRDLVESGAWALALNGSFVPVEEWSITGLGRGDTLAVLPPVSGG